MDSAFSTWVSAFPPERQQVFIDAVPTFNRACESVLGYDLIKIVSVSPHLRRAYVLVRCPKQPIYLMLVMYQGTGDWIVNTINWQTDPDMLLPPSMFGEQHPRQ